MTNNLSDSDKIELFLGRTQHKNSYFDGKIPPAWIFKSYHIDLEKSVNSKINPVKSEIFYTINNLGYNSLFDYDDNLKLKSNILCLGDSNTFGLLVQKTDAWPGRLQSLMESFNIMNLGLPGGSSDTVSRIGVNTVLALDNSVKAVLAVWPSYSRREFSSNKFHSMVYRTPNNDQQIPFQDYWDFIDWRSNSYNFYKNKILISSVCRSKNIPFFDLEIDDDFILHKEDTLRTFKKLEINSFGIDTHKAIANYFYKKINL